MAELIRAKEPFRFHTRLHLAELTGLKAATLGQLLDLIKTVNGSCIYHHTHRFLQQHQHFSPEPPNDFAYWVSEVLGEDELGEMLASIDTVQYSTIRDLRETIATTIEEYLTANTSANLKFSRAGEEFHFHSAPPGSGSLKLMLLSLNEIKDIYFSNGGLTAVRARSTGRTEEAPAQTRSTDIIRRLGRGQTHSMAQARDGFPALFSPSLTVWAKYT